MPDYLKLAESLKQAPAEPANYGGAAAALKQEEDERQKQAADFVAWKQSQPDLDPVRQADVLRYSAASGLAPAFVGEHLDDVKRQVDTKGENWAEVAKAHPEVFNLAGDPDRAALVKDDVANLKTVDWSLNPIRMVGDSWVFRAPWAALRDAVVQQTQTIPRQVAQGAGVGSEGNAKTIEELEQNFGRKDYGERSLLARAYLGIPKMLPMIAGDVLARGIGSGIGGLLAAPAALGGGAAAVETGPGAIPAGLASGAGAKFAGQFVGSWAFNTATTFGPLSWELSKIKDAEGNPIDPDVAQALALAASSVNGLLGAGLMGKIGESIPGVKEALQRVNAVAVTRALESVTARAAAKRLLTDYGEHVLTGASLLAMQSATNASAVEAARAVAGDPEASGWRIGDAGVEGFKTGLVDMALLAGLQPTRQFFGDLGRVKSSVANASRLQELVSVVQASKLLERSPETFEAFVAKLSPDAAVYIPVEAWGDYFKAKGLDPAAAAKELVGDGGRAFLEASATKGDLRLPLSRFVFLARTEHAKALLDDAKLRPQDLTPRQAAAESERLGAMMQNGEVALDPEAARELEAKPSTPAEAVANAAAQPIEAAVRAMTPEERAAFDQAGQESRSESERVLLERMAKGQKQRAWVESERKRLVEDAELALDDDPRYRAIFQLQQSGEPKLSRAEFVERFGKAQARAVESEHPYVFAKKDGRTVSLDEAATRLGFDYPEDLVSLLSSTPRRERAAQMAAERALEERYRRPMAEHGTRLAEDALAATYNPAEARRVLLEMRGLRRAIDPNTPPDAKLVDLEKVRATAERLTEGATVAELQPGRHLLAAFNAAKKALDAAAKNRLESAYDWREAQLLSQEMHRATRDVKEEMDSAQERLSKTARDAWRAQLGLADEGSGLYLEAHDSIIKALGMGEGPAGARALEAFDTLVQRMVDGADDPEFDATAIRQLLTTPKPFKLLTVREARNVADAVAQIRHFANDANKVRIGGEKAAVRDVVGRIAKEMEALPDKGKAPASKTQASKVRDALLTFQAADANLLGPEVLFGFMGESAKRFFWDRYLEARKVKDELSAKVLKVVDEHWSKLPKAMAERRYEVVPDLDRVLPIPEGVNLAGPRDRSWLWMVALNMGNASNRERLLGGFEWSEQQVLGVLNRPVEKGGLSREEWHWVESVWKLADETLWPLVAAKETAKYGLPPKKIQATPITLADGSTVSGGYWPAKYSADAAAGDIGARQSEAAIASLYGPSYARASTQKSHTKKRADHYENVLDLNWSVAPGHIAQVIHDLAFDLFVRDSARVLEDPAMRQTLFRRLGEERAKQPREWLKTVANEQADAIPGHLSRFLGMLGGLRSRAVMGAIGGSISVALGDVTGPLVAFASGDVSAHRGTVALSKTIARFPTMRAKALELSPELRHRSENNAQELRKALAEIGTVGKQSKVGAALETARATAFFMNEQIEKVASTAIFWGALADAQAKGKTSEEAIRHADAMVRSNLPSFNPAEQSALMRDKRGIGSLLVFHSYFNLLYGKTRRIAHEPYMAWHQAEGLKGAAVATWQTAAAVGRVLGMFAAANVAAEYLSGRGQEDDETKGQWLARKMLSAPFSIVPFGSTLGEPLSAALVTGEAKKVSIRAAPALSTLQTMYEGIGKLADENRDNSKKVWDAVELMLLGLKLPARQPRKTGEYLTGLVAGQEQPGNAAEVVSGLVYGQRERQPANPASDLGQALEGKR